MATCHKRDLYSTIGWRFYGCALEDGLSMLGPFLLRQLASLIIPDHRGTMFRKIDAESR